jgi:hypothetical protein
MIWLLFAVLIAVWIIACLRRIEPHERLLVYQRGLFSRVTGPGVCLVIFPEEEALLIKLDEYVPGWRRLTPLAIEREFERLAELGKLPSAHVVPATNH